MATYLTYDKQKIRQFNLPSSNTHGWNNAANSFSALGQIAQDLPDMGKNADGISGDFNQSNFSMPSPWARFISFETLLFDDTGIYGSASLQALNDWRCLITIVALNSAMGLDINLENSQWSYITDISKDGNTISQQFYTNVRQMYPQNSMFTTYGIPKEWDIFIPILLAPTAINNNDVIGFLSNSTLVCPAYTFSLSAKSKLSAFEFFQNGAFCDPVMWINRDPNHAYIMDQYLTNLHATLAELSGRSDMNVYICQKLIKLVGDFKAQILPLNPTSAVSVSRAGLIPDSVANILADSKVTIPEPASDVKLMTSNTNAGTLYIVGENMFGTRAGSAGAGQIHIAGRKTLAQLTPNFRSGDTNFDGYNFQNNEKMYRDTDLLLDKLYLVMSQNSIFNQGADGSLYTKLQGKDIIWPVNSVLLEYMTSEELKGALSVSFDGVNSYTVTLTLPLTHGTHTFSKQYSDQNVVIKMEGDFPNLSIWPYAKVVTPGQTENHWKSYYSYKGTYEDSPSVTTVTELCCDGTENHVTSQTRLDNISSKGFTAYYTSYSELPTHIKVYEKQNMYKQFCGCVLLTPAPTYTISEQNVWNVGVDFGTTSSTVYKRENGKEFIEFGTFYWNEFDSQTGKTVEKKGEAVDSGRFNACVPFTLKDSAHNFFMPDDFFKRNSYPSIYEIMTAGVPTGADSTFVFGHIPFDYAKGDRRDATQAENAVVYDNLKWSNDPNVREASSKYLHQIFIEIAFSAVKARVGTINWKFSYPTALPLNLLTDYKNKALDILNFLTKQTGIKMISDKEEFYPESIVSAEFFQQNYQMGTVACVDIGGGTTDISIWKRGIDTKNLLQTSIKLASRDIFLPSFWKLLRSDGNAYENILKLKRSVYEFVRKRNDNLSEEELPKLEQLLFEYPEAVFKYVGAVTDMNDKVQFEKTLTFGFFALMYYVMDSIAMAYDELKDEKSITVCIGGNGAKLVDWLSIPMKNLEQVLQQYLNDEYGISITVFVKYQNQTLKSEAAIGLLTINDNVDSFAKNLKLPASETLTVEKFNGETETIGSGEDIMSREDIKDYFYTKGKSSETVTVGNEQVSGIKSISVSKDLTALKKVIKYFNILNELSFGEKKYLLNYTDADFDSIHQQMQFALNEAVKDARLDPAFVFGIKSILRKENN